MERKQIFSIKKLKIGAASVLIGTGIVFLGAQGTAQAADTEGEKVTETTEVSPTEATSSQKDTESAPKEVANSVQNNKEEKTENVAVESNVATPTTAENKESKTLPKEDATAQDESTTIPKEVATQNEKENSTTLKEENSQKDSANSEQTIAELAASAVNAKLNEDSTQNEKVETSERAASAVTDATTTDNKETTEENPNIVWTKRNGNANLTLDKDGLLTIEPVAGTDGKLNSILEYGYDKGTILEEKITDKAKIKRIVVKDGVKGNKNMQGAFSYLTNVEELDLSGLDTSDVEDMQWMLSTGIKTKKLILGENFDTSKVKNMKGLFDNLHIKSLTLGDKFNTKNVTDMSYMFYAMSELEYLDLGKNFDTSNVKDMSTMFTSLRNLKFLNLGENFDTSNVENMRQMFFEVSSLENLNLGSKFNTKNVKNMETLFFAMRKLKKLDLGENFDTSSAENMSGMFESLWEVKTLDLGDKFNTSKVKNMVDMFDNMVNLENLNLGENFDTSNVQNMGGMFSRTPKLKTLNLGDKFNTENVTNMGGMFQKTGIENLNLGDKFDTSKVTDMRAMFAQSNNEFAKTNLGNINLGDKFIINSNTKTEDTYYNLNLFSKSTFKSITLPARASTNEKNIFDLIGPNLKWAKDGEPVDNATLYGATTLYPAGTYELYTTKYVADPTRDYGSPNIVEKVKDGVQVVRVGTKQEKDIKRTINFVDNVTGEKIKDSVIQTVTLTNLATVDEETGTKTDHWSTGEFDGVEVPTVDSYIITNDEKITNEKLTVDSKDETIDIKYQEVRPYKYVIQYLDGDDNNSIINEIKIEKEATKVKDDSGQIKWNIPYTKITNPFPREIDNKYELSRIIFGDEEMPKRLHYVYFTWGDFEIKGNVDEKYLNPSARLIYTHKKEDVTKTVTRTIRLLDAKTGKQLRVSRPNSGIVEDAIVKQVVTLKNVKDLVTGKLIGEWSGPSSFEKAFIDENHLGYFSYDTEYYPLTEETGGSEKSSVITTDYARPNSVSAEKITADTKDSVVDIYITRKDMHHEGRKVNTIYKADPTKDYGYREPKDGDVGYYEIYNTYSRISGQSEPTVDREVKEIAPKQDTIITLGTKPKVEEKVLDFATKYVADESLEAGTKKVEFEGEKGVETTTTTYTLNEATGEVTANAPTTQTTAAKDRVIKVGTKPKVEEVTSPIEVKYVADNTKDSSYRNEELGKAKVTTTTTTYTLNDQTGEVTPSSTTTTTAGTPTIITLGTKSEKDITRTIEYVDATTGAEIKDPVVQKVTLVKYDTIDEQTGARTSGTWTAATSLGAVEVPDIENYARPLTAISSNTSEIKVGQTLEDEDIVVRIPYNQGQEGVHESKTVTRTIKYIDALTGAEIAPSEVQTATLSRTNIRNKVTGVTVEGAWNTAVWSEVTSPKVDNYNTPTVEKVASEKVTSETSNVVEKVYYGKTTSTSKEIPFGTTYKEDKTQEVGYRKVETKGLPGVVTTTTTYTPNAEGVVSETKDESQTPAVTEVIVVGTKEKVETKDLDFATKYVADESLEAGTTKVEFEGEKGVETTTTTYTLNEATGEVTANAPTTQTTAAKDRVVKVGTKPTTTVANTNFATRYVADESLEKGQRVTREQGQLGSTSVTTTYTVDEQTGAVTEHQGEEKTTPAKEEVIAIGTKPTTSTQTLPFTKEVRNNRNLPVNEVRVVQEGRDGEVVTTTTYTLNEQTGELTENTSSQTTPAIVEISEVGTRVEDITEELPVLSTTRHLITGTTTEILPVEVGTTEHKTGVVQYENKNYQFDTTVKDEKNGITTHYYKLVEEKVPEDAPKQDELPILQTTRHVDKVGKDLFAPEIGFTNAKEGVFKVGAKEYTLDSESETKEVRTYVYKEVLHDLKGDGATQDELPILQTTRYLVKGDNTPIADVDLEYKDPKELIVFEGKLYQYDSTVEKDNVRTHYYTVVQPTTTTPQKPQQTKVEQQTNKPQEQNNKVVDKVTKATPKQKVLPKTTATHNNNSLGYGALTLLAAALLRRKNKKEN